MRRIWKLVYLLHSYIWLRLTYSRLMYGSLHCIRRFNYWTLDKNHALPQTQFDFKENTWSLILNKAGNIQQIRAMSFHDLPFMILPLGLYLNPLVFSLVHVAPLPYVPKTFNVVIRSHESNGMNLVGSHVDGIIGFRFII